MKKYAVIMIAFFALAVMSSCASSKGGNCPAYSQNAQSAEQLAQR